MPLIGPLARCTIAQTLAGNRACNSTYDESGAKFPKFPTHKSAGNFGKEGKVANPIGIPRLQLINRLGQ